MLVIIFIPLHYMPYPKNSMKSCVLKFHSPSYKGWDNVNETDVSLFMFRCESQPCPDISQLENVFKILFFIYFLIFIHVFNESWLYPPLHFPSTSPPPNTSPSQLHVCFILLKTYWVHLVWPMCWRIPSLHVYMSKPINGHTTKVKWSLSQHPSTMSSFSARTEALEDPLPSTLAISTVLILHRFFFSVSLWVHQPCYVQKKAFHSCPSASSYILPTSHSSPKLESCEVCMRLI